MAAPAAYGSSQARGQIGAIAAGLPKPATSPLRPKKTWTKEQREEATAKNAQEADAAASVGLRRSPRARVPTEKVLK